MADDEIGCLSLLAGLIIFLVGVIVAGINLISGCTLLAAFGSILVGGGIAALATLLISIILHVIN